MLFSANLGFLYSDRPFLDQIEAAARDGFDGVECHWPYDIPAMRIRELLVELDIPMLGLNTSPGDRPSGAFGLAAIPEMRTEARWAIRQGVDYGVTMGAHNLHVLAGYSDGGKAAEETFRDNLCFACDLAAVGDLTILIEPLNPVAHPSYHLSRLEHAADIIADLARPNLKLMFDCYHVQITQGALLRQLESLLPVIGHLQIAAIPDRGEPDEGQVEILPLLSEFQKLGYDGWVGAEYRPRMGSTESGLRWLPAFREGLEQRGNHGRQ